MYSAKCAVYRIGDGQLLLASPMQRHSPPSDAPLCMIQLLLACKAPNCLKEKEHPEAKNAAMIFI